MSAITAYFTDGKIMDFSSFLLVMARLCALRSEFLATHNACIDVAWSITVIFGNFQCAKLY